MNESYSVDLQDYKIIYLDTNAASEICKPDNGVLSDLISEFLIEDGIVFGISFYTLYEISKSKKWLDRFQKVLSLLPIVLLRSYFPLAHEEFLSVEANEEYVSLFIAAPVGIKIDGKKMRPDSLQVLMNMPYVAEGLNAMEGNLTVYLQELTSLFQTESFLKIRKITKGKRDRFISAFVQNEFKTKFHIPENVELDEDKVSRFKSMHVLANCVYERMFADSKRQFGLSDLVDVLIMTTVPYVHVFVSEKNSIGILRGIKNRTKLLEGVGLHKVSEFGIKA